MSYRNYVETDVPNNGPVPVLTEGMPFVVLWLTIFHGDGVADPLDSQQVSVIKESHDVDRFDFIPVLKANGKFHARNNPLKMLRRINFLTQGIID